MGPKKTNLITIKRKWRRCTVPSFRRCTKQPVVRPEEQVECPDFQVVSRAQRVEIHLEKPALVPVDPPSRRLTKQLIGLLLLIMNSTLTSTYTELRVLVLMFMSL